MKMISKAAAALVVSMTALAGAASADTGTATTKLEFLQFEDGAGNTLNAQGLSFGLKGDYRSGFHYDIEAMALDADGGGISGAAVELGYRFSGLAGPLAVYEVSRIGGVSSDSLLLGVEGGTKFNSIDVFGKALVDTSSADNYRIGLGARYAVNDRLGLTGEFTHFINDNAQNSNLFEVGASYRVTKNMFGTVGLDYSRVNGGSMEMRGLSMGLGFSF